MRPADSPFGSAAGDASTNVGGPQATMDEGSAVAALAALAQPMRLRVFRALVGAGPSGQTPGVLAATLGLPASSLSFHLKELTASRLVTAERCGRHIVYRPAIGSMNALLGYLTRHCCDGVPCGLDARGNPCAPTPVPRDASANPTPTCSSC
jgi:DNA-binding transcriptional ArsR family regulator